MRWGVFFFLVLLMICAPIPLASQTSQSGGDFAPSDAVIPPGSAIPKGVILVKGAWASASDSVTPVPEGGGVNGNTFRNQYFGMTYALPKGWIEKYQGPPPSDTGRYVLAQLRPAEKLNGSLAGTMLITAQDMFFTPLPASNALQLVTYNKDNLQADYKLELATTQTKIGGRPFVFYAYWSPVAELHWYVLATEIRCHAVEIVLTSRDTKLLESLVLDMNQMGLPAEASPTGGRGGGTVPVCMANYANGPNVISRVEPVFSDRTFNPVPVRIIVDKTGKVKHIHFLSAFPNQTKAISAALTKWRFKPYIQNGQPTEVETGIMFGNAPRHMSTRADAGSVD